MATKLTVAERDRRWRALSGAMSSQGYDALVFAANDYRGHKGALRYVADYNLPHRYGYVVMAPAREPVVVLGNVGSRYPKSYWVQDVRYARTAKTAVRDVLKELPRAERVGVVGMNQVMRVEEYLFLRDELPGTSFEDASQLFEAVRAIKSPEEILALEESSYIVDRSFERLLEVARPGLTERELNAEVHRVATALGGEDFLFLTVYMQVEPDGTRLPHGGTPRDRILRPGDQFIFSFELIGPSGYWVEFARVIVFGKPTELQERLHRASAGGLEQAQQAMRPGVAAAAVQEALLEAVRGEGADSAAWSGHGIGQDVIEEPWVGREVIQDGDSARRGDVVLQPGMAIALHPYVMDSGGAGVSYTGDTFVVQAGGARKLSEVPLEIHVPHRRRPL
jgi:Xaa-Pro aminopeptidase